MNRVVSHHAEGAAAVGDHLVIAGELVEVLLQLGKRNGAGTLDVTGIELVGGADVDDDDVATPQSLEQLIAAYALDLLAEVITRRPLDLRQPLGGGVSQGEPEAEHVLARQFVPDLGAVPFPRDQAGGVQGLQVLGGVRHRLLARLRELVDSSRTLGQEVEQLEATGAPERLPHHRNRLEQRRLPSVRLAHIRYSIELLISCQDPMYFRQFLNDDTACASYLFGCKTAGKFAVVDAHADLVDDYVAAAASQGSEIVAVVETHIQADHLSGLSGLVERSGATAYMPEGSGAEFAHRSLADGEVVELGNTVVEAIATPGHAPAHHSYLVTDHRRGEEPWFVLTGDSLLVGDVGRPDLHAAGALLAGVVADAIDFGAAIAVVAGLTALSGLWVAFDLPPRTSLSRVGESLQAP
jgi:hypothetical protein